MKVFLIALLNVYELVAAEMAWSEYKSKFGKSFNVQEDVVRRARFEQVNARVREHNHRFQRGLETYSMEHNKFTDMSHSEKYDLRHSKCMPPIKDQGRCGSCWAFSATTPIEYQKCAKTRKLVTLSEQQLVDCVYNSTTDGCDGGTFEDAWIYLYRVGGDETSAAYPYTSALTGTDTRCRFSPRKVYVKLANGGTSLPQNEVVVQRVLVDVGPISFAFYVADSFFSYKDGIYSEPRCEKDLESLNHEMVIVGYGIENYIPYWIVRNSWSTDWGLAGYALVRRGTNECGLADDAAHPNVI